ncbi:MAG: MFS transporter [Chloroflexota bacterium]|nr:MFS transporter [Chloroflexota bacterium]
MSHAPTADPAVAAAEAPPPNRAGLWLAIIAAGVLLGALDQTVVVTVLYKVQEEYQIAPTHLDQLGWVITAYLLGYTVTLPLMGRVADVYGRRRVYLGCLAIFMVGSVVAALSQTLEWLVAARVVQAIGGGALLPVSMAMVRGWYGADRRAFALGLLGAAAEGGGVLGPLWGVGIISLVDWRWIFWLNLPLGAILAVLVWYTPAHTRYPGRVDWLGAGLLGGALLALTLGLSSSAANGALAGIGGLSSDTAAAPVWQTPALLIGALLLGIAFVLWERRSATPLVPPGIFRPRPFLLAHLLNALVGMALITAMVNIPLLVASVLGGGAVDGGLLLLRLTLLIPVGAVIGGALAERRGYRVVAAVGMALIAAGFWLMSGWQLDTGDLSRTLHLALAGLGFGLVIAPITTTTLAWATAEQAGLAAALVNTARMVGMMIGLSAITSWALELFKHEMAGHPAPIAPLTGETQAAFAARSAEYPHILAAASLHVYTVGFTLAAIVALIGILPALGLRRRA